jgi:hypothetical protein
MTEFREKISRWKYLSKSKRWGLIITYISIFIFAYLTLWMVIEPLSLPERIQIKDYYIERRILHIIISIFIAAHGSLLISLSIIQNPRDVQRNRGKASQNDLGKGIKLGGTYKETPLYVTTSEWSMYDDGWVKSGWLYSPSLIYSEAIFRQLSPYGFGRRPFSSESS